MESLKIYLSGGMSDLTLEQQLKWRKQVENAVFYGDYDYKKKPIFFNPVNFYNFEEVRYKSEKEVMEYDLYNLRNSDLVIVNFNDPKSIGTACELILAKEYHIPVIGLNKDGVVLHSWLSECCTRICDNMSELVEHVVEFYLN